MASICAEYFFWTSWCFEERYATCLAFNQSLNQHFNMRLGQALLVIEMALIWAPPA